jgi:hypothetical protein
VVFESEWNSYTWELCQHTRCPILPILVCACYCNPDSLTTPSGLPGEIIKKFKEINKTRPLEIRKLNTYLAVSVGPSAGLAKLVGNSGLPGPSILLFTSRGSKLNGILYTSRAPMTPNLNLVGTYNLSPHPRSQLSLVQVHSTVTLNRVVHPLPGAQMTRLQCLVMNIW